MFNFQLNLKEVFYQLSRALRDLPNRVLNVAVEERLSLFQNVSDVLDNPGKFIAGYIIITILNLTGAV